MTCHYIECVIGYDIIDGGWMDVAFCGHTHGGLILNEIKCMWSSANNVIKLQW